MYMINESVFQHFYPSLKVVVGQFLSYDSCLLLIGMGHQKVLILCTSILYETGLGMIKKEQANSRSNCFRKQR